MSPGSWADNIDAKASATKQSKRSERLGKLRKNMDGTPDTAKRISIDEGYAKMMASLNRSKNRSKTLDQVANSVSQAGTNEMTGIAPGI